MRKLIIAATTIAALAAPAMFAVPAMADNGHTGTTLEATTVYNGVTYVHDYTLTTVSPSAHTFTGVSTADSPVGINETVQGTIQGQTIHITGEYLNGSGYTWHYDGPLSGGTGGDNIPLSWHTSFTTSHADNS